MQPRRPHLNKPIARCSSKTTQFKIGFRLRNCADRLEDKDASEFSFIIGMTTLTGAGRFGPRGQIRPTTFPGNRPGNPVS
jgi:hypothetical protein